MKCGVTQAVHPSRSPVGVLSQQVLGTDISSQLSFLPHLPAGISGGSDWGVLAGGDLWLQRGCCVLECVLCVTCPAETWAAARGLLSSHHTPTLQPVCLLLPSLLRSTCVMQGTRALIPYKLLYLAVTGLTPVTIPVFEHSQASTELVCPWLTTSSWPV